MDVGTLSVAYKDSGNTVRVSDNSKVSAETLHLGVNEYGGNRFELLSGSELMLSGNMYDGALGAASQWKVADTGNCLLFEGDGTLMECSKDIFIGRYYGGKVLEIANGAKAVMGTLYVGSREESYPTSRNRVNIIDSDVVCDRISISPAPGDASNEVYVAGSGCTFTARVNRIPRYPLFGRGGCNRLTLADRAKWTYPLAIAIDEASSNNVFTITGGAELHVESVLFSGTNHVLSCDNGIVVRDGGILRVQGLHISRFGNCVTVSNGTIVADRQTESNSGVRIGTALRNVAEETIADNGLVLQGERPSVQSAYDVTLENGSQLRFDIPEAGYDAGAVLIQTKWFKVDASSRIMAVGARSFQRRQRHTSTFRLVKATKGIALEEGVLEGANAALAQEGCVRSRFCISEDGQELRLVIPATCGTVMVVR